MRLHQLYDEHLILIGATHHPETNMHEPFNPVSFYELRRRASTDADVRSRCPTAPLQHLTRR